MLSGIVIYAYAQLICITIGLFFITLVVKRQRELNRLPIASNAIKAKKSRILIKEAIKIRKLMTVLCETILIFSIVPISTDLLTLFVHPDLQNQMILFVIGGMSLSVILSLATYMIWKLYKLSE